MDQKKNEEKNSVLKESINYIKKEQAYLLWSGIFPIYSVLVNIVNFVFIMLAVLNNWILIRRLVDILVPISIFLVVSIFSSLQFAFLRTWKKECKYYEKRMDYHTSQSDADVSRTNPSLTGIFYSLISYMEKTRIIFIIQNIVAVVYMIWGFDFFIIGISLSLELQRFARITWYLNGISVFVLLAHLIYQWYHFIKWNRKLSRIKQLEKEIFDELNL